jgi:predicted ATP-dependent endonuclease of OLD family
MPKIQMWRPSPKYLINETIDLENFKEDPNISIPLKNVFLINGITTNEEIKNSIERALADQAKCDALKDKMEEATTKYINKIWKEHNIKIKLSINATNCEVHIEDKDKKFVYYTMAQRSDGFKQFISLIFSLSAQNKGDILKNNLILIDEPEIHLHPSGIQYMRDEILKIGKNNYVFVATHSNYMIDSNARERYWIVEKEKSETKITQVNEDYNFTDNKVLSPAFGLNIFKELLPKNIILVEGENDKNIILHAINLLNKTFFCSIKEVGGASKMPIFARLLQEEKITPFILLDADKEGNECKKKILDEQRDFYSDLNVFTLKDLLSDLPKEATIEDLLPIDFVKSFSDCEMEDSFDLKDNDTIIHQLKRQNEKLQEDKYKLNSLKTKLAISFCNKYKTKFEEKVPKLALAVNVLFKKINEYYELQ